MRFSDLNFHSSESKYNTTQRRTHEGLEVVTSQVSEKYSSMVQSRCASRFEASRFKKSRQAVDGSSKYLPITDLSLTCGLGGGSAMMRAVVSQPICNVGGECSSKLLPKLLESRLFARIDMSLQ